MGDPSHIIYPVPLREGVVVRIYGLPDDLTKREAERVAAVILALGEKPMTWPAVDGESEYASWLGAAPKGEAGEMEAAKGDERG